MKKTLTTILLTAGLAASASAASSVYNVEASGNYNYHAFYLTLTSTMLAPETGSLAPTANTSYTLDQLTIITRTSSHNSVTGTYGLFVLNETGSAIIGFSNESYLQEPGTDRTFTFVAADGTSPLALNSSTTYRFVAVSDTALEYAAANAAANTTLNYSSSKSNASYTTATKTISGGLITLGGQAVSTTDAGMYVITNAALTNTGTYAAGLKDITISPVAVPEPATATLSLLALAGLAARRRRK